MQFDTRPQLPCRQLCPEQNAEISPAKVQCSWKTATQNNCSRINAVLGHWTYGGSRSSFNPLSKIISFLELIPFSHSSEEPCPGWSGITMLGQVQPQLTAWWAESGFILPKAVWVPAGEALADIFFTFGHSHACYHYKRAVRQQSHSTSHSAISDLRTKAASAAWYYMAACCFPEPFAEMLQYL